MKIDREIIGTTVLLLICTTMTVLGVTGKDIATAWAFGIATLVLLHVLKKEIRENRMACHASKRKLDECQRVNCEGCNYYKKIKK